MILLLNWSYPTVVGIDSILSYMCHAWRRSGTMVSVLLDGWWRDSRRLTVSISIKNSYQRIVGSQLKRAGDTKKKRAGDTKKKRSWMTAYHSRRASAEISDGFWLVGRSLTYRHGSRFLICHAEVCFTITYGRRSETIGWIWCEWQMSVSYAPRSSIPVSLWCQAGRN